MHNRVIHPLDKKSHGWCISVPNNKSVSSNSVFLQDGGMVDLVIHDHGDIDGIERFLFGYRPADHWSSYSLLMDAVHYFCNNKSKQGTNMTNSTLLTSEAQSFGHFTTYFTTPMHGLIKLTVSVLNIFFEPRQNTFSDNGKMECFMRIQSPGHFVRST